MSNQEHDLHIPNHPEIQRLGRRDASTAPPLIMRQTNTLLGLFYQGAVQNPELAKEYLQDYTLEYINAAAEESDALYNQNVLRQNVDVEDREAAGHAFIVMGLIRELTRSTAYESGFARNGVMAPPQTRKEFLYRIRELQIGLAKITAGFMEPHMQLARDKVFLRTILFFRTGSRIQVKLTESEQKIAKMQKEQFEDMIGGIDLNL